MDQQRWLQFGGNDGEYEPAPDISPSGMAISAVPVVVVTLVSLYLRLGNVQAFLIAAIRCVAQLLVLGSVLYPIFVNNQPYVVLPYIFIMIVFATREASVKPKHRYQRMRLHMLLSLTLGVSVSFSILTGLVLRPTPWWDASVMIPVCGMLMGSSVNALSLGMDRLLLSLSDSGRGSARLQTYLACGASRWEASLPSVREAIETGLTPNLNQMSIMGLVSIPGMMAGQILGGTPPFVAAKYQIVIMFFICSNSTMVLLGVILQAVFWALFDGTNRFCSEIVTKRKGGKPKDIVLTALSFVIDHTCPGLSQKLDDSPDNGTASTSVGTNAMNSGTSVLRHSSVGHTMRAKEVNECNIKSGTFRSRADPSLPASYLGSQSPQELLSLKNGTIEYENKLYLSSLNMMLCKGDVVVVTGSSGCGKSSFLRALALFEPLGDAAALQLNGDTVNEVGATIWRSKVCYARQQGGQGLRGTPMGLLTDLCALNSQRLKASKAKDLLEEAQEMLQQNIETLNLPPEMVNQRWDMMSGGESQRVYLCVLLALRPSVILLDEPTSACDEANSLIVEKLLLDCGFALVWVTHDPAQLERLLVNSRTRVMEYNAVEGGKEDANDSSAIDRSLYAADKNTC